MGSDSALAFSPLVVVAPDWTRGAAIFPMSSREACQKSEKMAASEAQILLFSMEEAAQLAWIWARRN